MNIAKLIHLNSHPVQFGKSCQFTFSDDYFYPVKVMPTSRGLIEFNTTIDPMPWIKPEIYLRTGATTHDEVVSAIELLKDCLTPGMMLIDNQDRPIHILHGSGLMYTVLYDGKMQQMLEHEIKNLLPNH